MSTNADRARRAAEEFNAEFGEQAVRGREIRPEHRRIWAEEPVIVPLRAALEGNQYSGPTALEDFAADTRESWSSLHFEVGEIRELDENLVLMVGRLRAIGRDTGAEAESTVAVAVEFEEGRIAVFRTFLSESAALSAIGR